MTAEEERNAIVDYLRETADMLDALALERVTPMKCRHHAQSCRYAADAIEAGEHHYANP
jgi:hypothetical protein